MVDVSTAAVVRFVAFEAEDPPLLTNRVSQIVEYSIPERIKDRELWVARRFTRFLRENDCVEVSVQFF